MKPVNVELPGYLTTTMKIRAAEQQTSVRHIIMTALRKDGFTIAESDMIDASPSPTRYGGDYLASGYCVPFMFDFC